MVDSQPSALFSQITAPLFEHFGFDLTLVREGDCVRWCYADLSAVVELRSETTVAATFISEPIRDAATSVDVCAIYTAQYPTYALTERGVAHMVEDLTAFFSGVREPRFTFVDARVEQRGFA